MTLALIVQRMLATAETHFDCNVLGKECIISSSQKNGVYTVFLRPCGTANFYTICQTSRFNEVVATWQDPTIGLTEADQLEIKDLRSYRL